MAEQGAPQVCPTCGGCGRVRWAPLPPTRAYQQLPAYDFDLAALVLAWWRTMDGNADARTRLQAMSDLGAAAEAMQDE